MVSDDIFPDRALEKRLHTFKPAEKFYPEDAMVLSNIGWHHLAEKEFPTAKQYLMRADNNGFKNADVCRTIGSMLIDEGDYANALKYLEKAQNYLPKSPRTDWLTALAYLKTENIVRLCHLLKKL